MMLFLGQVIALAFIMAAFLRLMLEAQGVGGLRNIDWKLFIYIHSLVKTAEKLLVVYLLGAD